MVLIIDDIRVEFQNSINGHTAVECVVTDGVRMSSVKITPELLRWGSKGFIEDHIRRLVFDVKRKALVDTGIDDEEIEKAMSDFEIRYDAQKAFDKL